MGGLDVERIYRAMPVSVQHCMASMQGWLTLRKRYGPGYATIERAVEERAALHGAALRQFQGERLMQHLRAAAQTVYWREQFDRHGVRIGGSDPFAELARLPIISKRDVQDRVSELTNPGIPRGMLRSSHTSGTTGAGLVFPETAEAEMERWAVWWRFRRALGLSPKTRCGYCGGRSVVPLSQQRPPFWRFNYPAHQLLLSAYHLSDSTAAAYLEAIRLWGAEWLHGYPSFIVLLAEQSLAHGGRPAGAIRWITTGAENLLAGQRQRIEEAFGVSVRQHYGLAEAVANFSDSPEGVQRVDEDFAWVEFLPCDMNPGHYRIVGTNWSNPAFPLLRYDAGDTATLPQGDAADTGWRIVSGVDGRNEDYVTLPSGAHVGRLDHIFKDLIHVREAQIYQPSRERLVLRIVKCLAYDGSNEEARLLAEARARLGDEIGIEISYVPQIVRSRTGKLRFVISEIPRP